MQSSEGVKSERKIQLCSEQLQHQLFEVIQKTAITECSQIFLNVFLENEISMNSFNLKSLFAVRI